MGLCIISTGLIGYGWWAITQAKNKKNEYYTPCKKHIMHLLPRVETQFDHGMTSI